ncbi:hypothetical protein HJC23_004151 [Cyclotella cryptica]|uniref:Calmodulin-lysine N-methyltransferase n=1 Tax=Cyclotella cryptica TaxID=29204 RepID=A0ABD3PHS2_9STRA|eukprot:CCRYP_014691-RA/>CCRYP_014691-RA protein AED:0.02 eAED:0.02 QI:239/1/1/1/0/0/2/497/566
MTNPKSKGPRGNTKKKKSNNQKANMSQSSSGNTTQQTKQTTASTNTTKPQPKRTAQRACAPPIEAPEEYSDLLLTARSLNEEERISELMECARYGEVDAVRAILEVWDANEGDNAIGQDQDGSGSKHSDATCGNGDVKSKLVNITDSTGTTPLHKAAANGHVSTVSLLLSRGALHTSNENGNTPLHWAAGAGKADVCLVLLDHFDALSNECVDELCASSTDGAGSVVKPLDVLLKNSFGRSALTEGFASGDTKTVEVLLNHDSAEEERLIGGLNRKEVDPEECADEGTNADGKGSQEESKRGIIHEFDFRKGLGNGDDEECHEKSVLIRELPIAHPDNPFGQTPADDTTGLSIWCASLIMARWLSSPSMSSRLRDKHVLELGAGCAVPSLAAMTYGSPASVTISDLNPDTMENIQCNIGLNPNSNCDVKACSIDWADEETYPDEKMDFVICSDCIYQKDIVPLLKKVVLGTLRKPAVGAEPNYDDNTYDGNENGPSFLYVTPEGGRDGLPEFISTMKSHGFTCVMEEVAPESYRENPLKSGDEEDCFLHFHELSSTTYVLYEFRRC